MLDCVPPPSGFVAQPDATAWAEYAVIFHVYLTVVASLLSQVILCSPATLAPILKLLAYAIACDTTRTQIPYLPHSLISWSSVR